MFKSRSITLDSQPQTETAASSGATQEAEKPKDADDEVVQLTKRELKERARREGQAEFDRLQAKLKRDAEIADRRQKEKSLYEQDPIQYADTKFQEQTEAEQQAERYAALQNEGARLAQTIDEHLVDPVFKRLDESERAQILKETSSLSEFQQRRQMMEKSLAALEKKWKAEGAAEASKRLRTNPVLRQQTYIENRAQGDEPDVVPAAGSASNGHHRDMNDLIRSRFR